MLRRHRAARTLSALIIAPVIASCAGDASGPRKSSVSVITISPPSAEVGIGGTVPFQATVKDAADQVLGDRRVVWNVNDTSIATVSDAGVVTAKRVGTAQIAASSEGKFAIAVITVLPSPVASVAVVPPTVQVVVGGTVRLQAVAYDGSGTPLSGRQITWASGNPSVATVDAAGLVTGVAAGTASITATSEGKSGTTTVVVSDVPVARITVAPDPASVVVGQTTQLAATLKDAAGNVLSGRQVTWSTSNSSIATISSAGVVLGVSPGTVSVTASSGGQSGTASVVVNPVPASTVLVSPGSASLVVGGTTQLVGTVTDAAGNPLQGRPVVWTTSNGSVASVSASGLVTALSPGTATITATSEGKAGTATITVTAVRVASVAVTPTSASVRVGQTLALAAAVRGPNGEDLSGRTVSWTTSNAAVATVSASGVVTGVAPGTATITATSEGQVGTASVTVTPGAPARVVAVSGDGQKAGAGTTLPNALVVKVTDAGGSPIAGVSVAWAPASGSGSVSAATTVTDATGQASVRWTLGTKPGPQSLTATVASLPAVTFTAQATGGSVASVTVAPASVRLNSIGATTQLTAQAQDQFTNPVDAPITWASLSSTVAAVDGRGMVTARANGTARIVASAGAVADTATVTVQQVVATVTATPATASNQVGTTRQFSAAVKDSNGIDVAGAQVTWASSAPAVATIDQTGKAVAISPGRTAISAKAGSVTGTAQLDVTGVPVARVAITPNSLRVDVGETRQLTAHTYDAAGNELTGRAVTWSSSATSIATVDANGNVKGLKKGDATITATSEGKSANVAVTVK